MQVYYALNFNQDRDKEIFKKKLKLWIIVRIHVGNINKKEDKLEPQLVGMCTQEKIILLYV